MTTRVVADISISLDGYVTGPNVGADNALGDGGEALHGWVFEGDAVDEAVLRERTETSGAVIMGRRLFDVVDDPRGWNDEMGYGATHAATPPFFVVTHAAPESVRLVHDFTFVTDGVAAAIERAKAVAEDGDVVVMGGGELIRQVVEAGLADELSLHLSPVVLGGGTPLFGPGPQVRLVQRSVRVSSTATHLVYGRP
jgi:dihydrofolate reductase